jgi:maleylacetoacetate isomerase
MTTITQDPEFLLHTYFRSSCSARLRIALELKHIYYTCNYVNLLKNEQSSDVYDAINPSHLVPSLQPLSGPDTGDIITQSIAALEYLEERYPSQFPLLPPKSSPSARAYVRALIGIIACDIQPVTNLRILTRIGSLGGDKVSWAKDLMAEGLRAYERLVAKKAGRFSYGDAITMADVCLVPAVWGALRFRVQMEEFPVVSRIYREMSKEEAVVKAHWKNQADTPSELRNEI